MWRRSLSYWRKAQNVGSQSDLLTQVVNRFVDREVQKIKDSTGNPVLSREGHIRFLTDLAEEMWWQETRVVDIPTVQTLAELLAEDLHLSPTQVNIIVEKVPSNAFLSSGTGEGGLSLDLSMRSFTRSF